MLFGFLVEPAHKYQNAAIFQSRMLTQANAYHSKKTRNQISSIFFVFHPLIDDHLQNKTLSVVKVTSDVFSASYSPLPVIFETIKQAFAF